MRDRDTPEFETLVVDGDQHGPDLPDAYEWHPRTREWWETWRRSPMSASFIDTDWAFLVDTALMHSAMWSKGQWTLAAEVRLRVAKFGATPEDRMRLKLKIEVPRPIADNTSRVADLAARRARLSG